MWNFNTLPGRFGISLSSIDNCGDMSQNVAAHQAKELADEKAMIEEEKAEIANMEEGATKEAAEAKLHQDERRMVKESVIILQRRWP